MQAAGRIGGLRLLWRSQVIQDRGWGASPVIEPQAARPEAKPAQMAVPPHSSSRNGVPGRKVAEPGVPDGPRGPEGTQ